MKRFFITLLVLVAMVTGARAKTVINVTGQTATITQQSTLYVGEVVVDGRLSFYYMYSEDLTNTSTVFGPVRNSLTDFMGGIFSELVPYSVNEGGVGISFCSNSAYEPMMNSDWKDAYKAGQAVFSDAGVVSSSSNDLYQTDAAFAAKCTFDELADIIDNAGYPMTISGPIGTLSATNTDIVTYTVEGGELVKHIDRHIDYNCEMITVIYTRAELSSPLTFEAVDDGTISVSWSEWATPSLDVIQYKLNDGAWTDVAWNTPIGLAANDVICFRGDNGTCYDESTWEGFHFECSNDCYVYGNVMSVIDKDNFATNTTLTKPYAFFQLFMRADFYSNSTIKNHPTKDVVLPATTLTFNCYDAMFSACQGITRAPALPATTLAEWCYNAMFMGCTALISGPALPATTLAESCYADMFMGCTSLTTAPALPASTLVEGCYADMFDGCTSLNYVKCLATDISADYCTLNWLGDVAVTGTFVKDELMNSWPVGPDANSNVNGIPAGWTVDDHFDPYATPLTLEAATDGDITFNYTLSLYHDAELTDIEYQVNGGAWTTYTWNDAIAVVTGDKVAFRGNNASYFGNGKGYESCITSTADVYVYGNVMSLINSTGYPTLTTLTGKDALSHLFAKPGANAWEVVSNTTIQSHPTKDLVLPATTLTNMCYMDMFAGCQGLTRAPELPATQMTVACYAEMFSGCSGLTVAPALPATTFTPYSCDPVTFEESGSIDCYMSMFFDCTGLTSAPALPATTLVHGVYQNMFQGCTSLERAPELPAPVVADYAYSYMFDGCTSLNYVKCLATEFLVDPNMGNTAEDNVMNWLRNVSPTGTFVKAPSMNDWSLDSANGIPAGWTVRNDGEYTVTIPASGVGTFSAGENVTLPAGLTAYSCTAYDSQPSTVGVQALSGSAIPAGTGVLLRGTAGATYTLTATADPVQPVSGNALVAVTVPTHIAPTDGTYTNFMLKNGAFIRIADSAPDNKMPANKAYLQIPTADLGSSSTVRAITLVWDDDTATAIPQMEDGSRLTSDGIYDLQGRKLSHRPAKGVYLLEGKKVIIK